MKVLHLNFSDLSGGAARAAYRLHRGMRELGIDSNMLVLFKDSDDPHVLKVRGRTTWKKLVLCLEALPLKFCKNRNIINWNAAWVPNAINYQIKQLDPDIIHLHWICGGLLSVEALAKLPKPAVWTLHDCWAFTGGCHNPLDCINYQDSCGCCPQLGSSRPGDLSRWVWHRKARHWKGLNVAVVTPSHWLANCARDSSLFKYQSIETIPNGLDISKYKPFDPQAARTALGLPVTEKIILSDYHKGFSFLPGIMRLLTEKGWKDAARLVIFGASEPNNPPKMPLATNYLGFLKDEISISLTFAAADVFLFLSAQDNLPNTVLESLACGTPVVAFRVGGVPNMIDHEKNGYLAKPFCHDELALGLSWILEDKHRLKALRDAARLKVEREFEINNIVKKYLSLYKKVLSI